MSRVGYYDPVSLVLIHEASPGPTPPHGALSRIMHPHVINASVGFTAHDASTGRTAKSASIARIVKGA